MKLFLLILLVSLGIGFTAIGGIKELSKSPVWNKYRKYLICGVILTIMSTIIFKRLDDIALNNLKKEILQKNTKIEELTNVIINTITGGDNFCYLNINDMTDNGSADEKALVIINNGEYPLYNIQVKIYDLNLLPGLVNKSFSELETLFPLPRSKWIIDVEVISPHTIHSPRPIVLSRDSEIRYYVNISSRNGIVHQKFIMKYHNGKWVKAIQIYRKSNNIYNLIYEDIEKDFPIKNDEYMIRNQKIVDN